MTVATPIETRSGVWSPVLTGLRADLLDCLQSNLAALADRHHGSGTHLALGATLRFAADGAAPGTSPTNNAASGLSPTNNAASGLSPTNNAASGLSPTDNAAPGASPTDNAASSGSPTDAGGIPVVTPGLNQRLAEAEELLGLHAGWRVDGVDGPRLRELAAERLPLYVVADAYDLQWCPYAGREHLEHSFLLIAAGATRYMVADAYRNATRWGDMEPGVWQLEPAELDAAIRDATVLSMQARDFRPPDPASTLATNADIMLDQRGAIDRYVAALREHGAIDRLVLDSWLLARARGLHAAWLATVPMGAERVEAAAEQADSWLSFAGHSYVVMRRIQRGGGQIDGLIDRFAELAHLDVELAQQLAGGTRAGQGQRAPAEPDGRTHAVVVEELRAVLQLGDDDPPPRQPLRELQNYNSFRLVEIIERVETRLGVEVDLDRLTGGELRDLESLCRLFAEAEAGNR